MLIWRYGTFKIEAFDQVGGLGNIRSITVAQDVGPVYLHVVNPVGEAGAYDLGWVDLSNATVGNIAELRVAHFLGPDPDDQPTVATAITGPFSVPGEIQKDVSIETLESNAVVTIFRLWANLSVTGPGTHRGFIDIEHFENPTKTVSFAGTMAGYFEAGAG